MPVDVFTEISADERTEKRAKVDAHVERGKTRIAPRASFWIQIGDNRADAGFQQARADHDQAETKIERRRRGNGKRVVAGRNHTAAPEHGPTQSEKPIGNPAAGQRDKPHGGGIQTVNCRCRHIVETHSARGHGIGQKQHEDRAHAVVAEALPHFGEEERGKSSRMSKPPGGH